MRKSKEPACLRPLAAVFCLLAAAPAPAAALDLHRLWEERCAGCHGEAGDFARSTLHEVDGRLQGRRPERDLAAFLGSHRGGLPPTEAETVLAMLQAQAGTPPRFRERCGICHPKAADLVRDHLTLRDGVLVGRYSGRRMDEFLRIHGRLDAEGAAFFLALLTRIEGEVHHP
jgi:hypothetical protein